MLVILISDDRYFTKGVNASLESDFSIIIHDESSAGLIDFNFLNNTIVLISVKSNMIFLEIMCKINQLTNRVIVFTENSRCTRVQSVPAYQLVNKRISTIMLQAIVNGSDEFSYSTISLSGREKNILNLILNGMSSYGISLELGISIKTVSSHRINALKKLGLKKINQIGDLSKIYKKML